MFLLEIMLGTLGLLLRLPRRLLLALVLFVLGLVLLELVHPSPRSVSHPSATSATGPRSLPPPATRHASR